MKMPSVESLFNQWIASGGVLSPEEMCRGAPAGVLQALEERVAAYRRSQGPMSHPPMSVSGEPWAGYSPRGAGGVEVAGSGAAGAAPVGMRIGRYTIVRLIGEGGMGTVYEALQESPKRSVALKLIRPGLLTPAMLRWFSREAEVLGRLQDAGIAQIYEAGSATTAYGPQPFLAMELVPGEPLTKYAESRGLDARQRLQMVARVAEAVHHAHQRGVIHRDLKPGNILVTGAGGAVVGDGGGLPKILDFGLAKRTDADVAASAATELGSLMGTLPYMAPEQTEGSEGIDTRTDVYALGVIAYELLAGRRPLEVAGKSVPEALRMIREEEPPGLSGLNRDLRGDVETIVRKAMAKEKRLRYESAHALAEDIGRYLNDEPIAARPASTWYQLGKFARRNRVLVGGVLTVFIVLAAGFAGTTAGFVGQRKLRMAAEQAQRDAEAARVREADALAVANAQRESAESALREMRASRERELEAAAARGVAEAEARLQRGAATRAQAAERTALSALDEEVKRRAEIELQKKAAEAAAAREARQALSAGMQVYAMNIRTADAAVAAGDLGTARTMLDLCPEALRGWEWNYLNLLAGKPPMDLPATRSRAMSVALSPDGQRVAAGYADATARVWDATSGKELLVLSGHTAMVQGVQFAPGGRQIVTAAGNAAGTDCTARIWDAETGQELQVLRGHRETVRSARFSPDGSKVVTGSDDGTARVWEARTGRQLLSITCGSAVKEAVFSPRGMRIATAGNLPAVAQVWNSATGARIAAMEGESAASAVSFSPEFTGPDSGRLLVGCADGKVRTWEFATGRRQELEVPQALPETPAGVLGAAYGTVERHVLLAMADGTVRVFEGPRQVGELRGPQGTEGWVAAAGLGGGEAVVAAIGRGDRRVAAVMGDGRVRLWTTVFGEGAVEIKETAWAAFSPDGRYLATVSEVEGLRTPMIRESFSGKVERRMTGRELGGIRAVAYSGNGKRIGGWGAAGQGSIVSVWEAETGRQLMLARVRNNVGECGVALSADGELVYTGGDQATAWEASGGKLVRTFGSATDQVSAVELSPDGRQLAAATWEAGGGSGGVVHLWNTATSELILDLPVQPRVAAMTFTPDGRQLLCRGEDGVITVWDVQTGERVRVLPGAAYRGKPVFSPGGGRLTAIMGGAGAGGGGARVSFCDAEKGVELCAIRQPATGIGWSPDGSRFLLGNGSVVKIWDSGVPAGRTGADAGAGTRAGG